jgi:mono/diheme cytochrome c family protein
MKTFVTLLVLALVVVLCGYAYIQSGAYDVAATTGSKGFLDQIAKRVADHSVEHHAQGIQPPPLGDPAQLKTGVVHYQEMCVTCHGAPGVQRSEIGAGLNPGPPALVRSVRDMSPAEVYWIVKNGVKMTGMPAFGPTHSEAELWAITALVKQLPILTPEQYKALAQSAGSPVAPPEEHEHEHGAPAAGAPPAAAPGQ